MLLGKLARGLSGLRTNDGLLDARLLRDTPPVADDLPVEAVAHGLADAIRGGLRLGLCDDLRLRRAVRLELRFTDGLREARMCLCDALRRNEWFLVLLLLLTMLFGVMLFRLSREELCVWLFRETDNGC